MVTELTLLRRSDKAYVREQRFASLALLRIGAKRELDGSAQRRPVHVANGFLVQTSLRPMTLS